MRRLLKHVSLWAAFCVLLLGCSDAGLAGGSADGPKIYKEACARCHGPEGVPSQSMQIRTGVKPLTTEQARGMSDERLREQIRYGSKNRLMPGFQGAMSDTQMEALVGHVRNLQTKSADL